MDQNPDGNNFLHVSFCENITITTFHAYVLEKTLRSMNTTKTGACIVYIVCDHYIYVVFINGYHNINYAIISNSVISYQTLSKNCEERLPILSCLSVCPSAWKNSAPTGRIFMKFDIWLFFENLSREFKVHYNLTRITGILHED